MHNEEFHHEENHENQHHHEENHNHGHHHNHNQHHHHHEEEKTYSMIEWDPAHQEPPKTGRLGADIPDLSYFKNVWDKPHFEQQHIWVAPVHQPEPQIMTKPEYANYNTDDYDSEILYPQEHNNRQHQYEAEHKQVEAREIYQEHHQHEEHHHHYHHEEPVYPPTFPWDSNPDHFPPPTRVWQDEEQVHHHHHEETSRKF